MKKIITLFILSCFIMPAFAQKEGPQKAAPKKTEALKKTNPSEKYITASTPKGWDKKEGTLGDSLMVYGTSYRLNAPKSSAIAIIYLDYYSPDNLSNPTSKDFIEKGTAKSNVIGNSRTEPEPFKIGDKEATQFFRTKILFRPPNSPNAVKTKIIERVIVADDAKKEGYYVLRVYADEDSYVETNEVFDKLLKTVKLLK